MRANWRKTAAILALTSHVLAITVAGVFHQHGSQPCGGRHESHPAAHEHSVSCCHHEQESACCETLDEFPWEEASCADSTFASEICPVCQFLAQKWIAADRSEADGVVDSVWEKPLCRSFRLPSPLLFSWQIRGPPVVA
jgi:hypothetical protein